MVEYRQDGTIKEATDEEDTALVKTVFRDNLGKLALFLLYLIGVLVLWLNRNREIRFDNMELLSPVILGIIRSLFPLFTVGGFLTVLVAVIMP